MDRKFNGVLFDIDGVLEFQGKAYPGAIELLEFLRYKQVAFRIISNSTLKSRKACAAKLNQLGFYVLEDAAGIKAIYIGKPGSYMFDLALSEIAVDPARVVMVGDRVATDILGARRAGLKSVLVKTGEFKESDLVGDELPDIIVDSVREIDVLF